MKHTVMIGALALIALAAGPVAQGSDSDGRLHATLDGKAAASRARRAAPLP